MDKFMHALPRFAALLLFSSVIIGTPPLVLETAVAATANTHIPNCNRTLSFQGKPLVICVGKSGRIYFNPVRVSDTWTNNMGQQEYGAWLQPVRSGNVHGDWVYVFFGTNQKTAEISDLAFQNNGYLAFNTYQQ